MGQIITPDSPLVKHSFIVELDRTLKQRHSPTWIPPKEHPTVTALWEVLWHLRAWTVLMGDTHDTDDLKTLEALALEKQFQPLSALVYKLFDAVKHPDKYPAWFSDYVKGDHAQSTE